MVFVGGGPKTTGILLSLAAALREDRGSLPDLTELHVVDPFDAGGGRIWRHEQSPTLWMNSVARDVTIFPDADASLGTAPVTGPDLASWVLGPGRTILEDRGLGDLVEGFGPSSFAPRQVQAAYLSWAFERAADAMPPGVEVRVHRAVAVKVESSAGRRLVRLEIPDSEQAEELEADVVVLAQGFVEIEDDQESRRLKSRSEELGLQYIAPGYTADVDLTRLEPGQDVLVRGFGLAFIDAMMMLTEDRGGRFRGSGSRTRYEPSGREPVLWVGSGRGVPYRSKLGYLPEGMRVGPTRYVNHENATLLCRPTESSPEGTLSVQEDIMPLLDMELFVAHYTELAHRHRQRAGFAPDEIERAGTAWIEAFLGGDRVRATALRNEADRWARTLVPDPRDHYDLARLDRPFAGKSFASQQDLELAVSGHVRNDLDRAADPAFSQDSAVFHALVGAYYVVRELVARGAVTPEDRMRNIDSGLHGLFSFIASGPPPERLENLLALHRAGLVRFVGPDMQVGLRGEEFEATTSAAPDVVRSRSLFDARLARISATRTKDSLLADLVRRGELRVEGDSGASAKFLIDADNHALDARNVPHHDVLMVGPSVAGSVEEAFSRPGTDAHVFRDNERLAGILCASLRAPVVA